VNPAALAPGWVTFLFVLLVAAMWALVVAGVYRARRAAGGGGLGAVLVTGAILAAWLGVIAVLAGRGFFENFRAFPPRFLLILLPTLLTLVYLARSRAVGALLRKTSSAWLIGAQSFRIVVELVLWQLVAAHAAPEIMSFTGRNFDVLVGLTAPIVAWLAMRPERRRLAIAWNVAGLVILVNTVIHAQLAALEILVTDPPNTFIASVPYVWLPGFLVPLAWSLHVLSIRRLRQRDVD